MSESHQRAQQHAGEDTAQVRSLGHLAVLAAHRPCSVTRDTRPSRHITTKFRDMRQNNRGMPISIAITAFSIAICEKTIAIAPKNHASK